MKKPITLIILCVFSIAYADVVKKTASVEEYINNLSNGTERTHRASIAHDDRSKHYESWSKTPGYFYIEASDSQQFDRLREEIENVLGKKFKVRADTQRKEMKFIKRSNPSHISEMPSYAEKNNILNTARYIANEFVETLSIRDDVEFHTYAEEITNCIRCEDTEEKLEKVTVFYRRLFDGAIVKNGKAFLKIEIDTTKKTIERVEMHWDDYKKVTDAAFSRKTIPAVVNSAENMFAAGRVTNEQFNEKFSAEDIKIIGAAKIWMQKKYNNKNYLLPGILLQVELTPRKIIATEEKQCNACSIEGKRVIGEEMFPLYNIP